MKDSSLAGLKGVGTVSLEKLKQAGILTRHDLIYFLPREYRQVQFIKKITDARPGQITVRARANKISTRRGQRRFVEITTAELEDDSGKMLATWFNQPYRKKQLANGEFYFSGEFGFNRGQFQLTNPSVQAVTASATRRLEKALIEPIYSTIRGLKSSFISKIMTGLMSEILILDEVLPYVIVKKMDLMPRSDALYQLHFPTELDLIERAKWRILLEKYLVANLASLITKEQNAVRKSPVIEPDYELVKRFVTSLPFKLTNDQRKAIWRILENLHDSDGLNCLLQGDVGSGKTIVALIVSLVVVSQGGQVAIMAPTEILATQHFQTAKKMLDSFDVRVVLLTSGLKKNEKTSVYQDLKTGKIDLIIGTHALIQPDVKFKDLQLAIIDEQHRFGVMQRQLLAQKAGLRPHLLSMTATPIPRSLALVLQNELKIISIRQKPATRLPIKTKIVSKLKQELMYQSVRKELDAGRQAYVVCSLIEDNEESDRQSVEKVYQHLSSGEFKNYRLAILHGKMKALEKEKIMADFAQKKYDVLIATTVVEVGVDVPNATVMIIENAENYGLSQLHQLRGRIGRGAHQSYCYLLDENPLNDNQRLLEIKNSDDGFYLAEVDLKLRGMGDLYGESQHGWFDLDANIQAIEGAARACEIYRKDLVARGVTAQDDLRKYPELWSQIKQFDSLTILN
ncbi:MAG: ATP-dependent DNA helicase RecG [Candidatus Saccharibacteria bacterium]|nr:ATP-dependent DNA helicase RecG [Candidatus Saccharibacteria bacterium]